MKKYHPAMVLLHWLLGVMIIFMLLLGGEMTLTLHLVLGLLVGGLFTLRLGIRYVVRQPRPSSRHPALNRLSSAAHPLIYGLVIAVILSGIGVVIKTGLLEVIQTQQPLPPGFSELAILKLHKLLQTTLLVVVCAHVGAALFHQFVLADKIFTRMWFSR